MYKRLLPKYMVYAIIMHLYTAKYVSSVKWLSSQSTLWIHSDISSFTYISVDILRTIEMADVCYKMCKLVI